MPGSALCTIEPTPTSVKLTWRVPTLACLPVDLTEPVIRAFSKRMLAPDHYRDPLGSHLKKRIF